jgi:transposase InsO family protein
MTISLSQGELTIERMCWLTGVSRSGYYLHWAASAPRAEQTGVRDAIQRLALAQRHYGYRRIAVLLRREGLAVNRKRVLRLMQQDNLLCLRHKPFVPVTTNSRHGWRVVPNLARGLITTGLDQLWVADITYIRLGERVRLSRHRARCLQPTCGRMGVGHASRGESGNRRPGDGDRSAPADARQSDSPLRPRHPIRLPRL